MIVHSDAVGSVVSFFEMFGTMPMAVASFALQVKFQLAGGLAVACTVLTIMISSLPSD